MPIKPPLQGLDAPPPIGNHLGVVLKNGQVAALPEGALLTLYDDNVGHPITLVLRKVSTGKLVFGLLDANGEIHTDYVFRLAEGKPLNRTSYERLKKEGKVK